MREIRNSDNRLVCTLDEYTGTVEICIKGCITQIIKTPTGDFKIINTKMAS